MKVATIAPVLNECPWIGYSIMSALPGVEAMHYGIDSKSDDGTFELLKMLSETVGKGKVFWYRNPDFDFDPMDTQAYNRAFNVLIGAVIETSHPDAILFLHPDMVVMNPEQFLKLEDGPLAWYTHIRSFAGDFDMEIVKGRALRWKNMHAPRFGLKYSGGYGSVNEDFYHADITGNSLRHYGEEFSRYPFEVRDSGVRINHYCELKNYKRRLEKMKLCLRTQHPDFDADLIEEMACQHPRVTLAKSSERFGHFEFSKTDDAIPEVVVKYRKEFESFLKEPAIVR